MSTESQVAMEKPQNGIAGLKHWRHDLVAGMVVSLISLPFSLGIAVASGAPPICGLISAIIAGLVLPFLGGSFVTISGPAAGLAPVLLASMALLGGGGDEAHLAVGYPLLLAAICITGVLQVVLARFGLARFAAIFPSAVVEGMLAAIGLLIIAKQLPLMLGRKFESHEFWEILAEAPSQFVKMEPSVFLVGVLSLILIFALASLKSKWLKIVPPQVIAAVFGLVLAYVLGVRGQYLIHLPDDPFKHGITVPNFAGFLADRSLLWPLLTTVLTLAMIDGVESLATISAIDKIDPFRRKSDPDRTLLAMGVSNMCSSVVGGLTIIPGGVKSTACIVSGGRTQWANFYNALFLIIYVVAGRSVINLLPYSTLGAIIAFTGYKLCSPKVWKHMAHVGGEQLFVFATTVLVTVSTDLLVGIAAGIATKFLLEAWFTARAVRPSTEGRESVGRAIWRGLGQSRELVRNPVTRVGMVDDTYHLFFTGPLVCFNSMQVGSALAAIPMQARSVSLHLTDLVTLLDHTTASLINGFIDDFQAAGRGVVRITGIERLRARSHTADCLRTATPVLASDREQARALLARLSLVSDEAGSVDALEILERISLTRVTPAAATDGSISLIEMIQWASGRVQALTRSLARAIDGFLGPDVPEFAHQLDRAALFNLDGHGSPVDVDRYGSCLTGDHPHTRIQHTWPADIR